MSHLIPKIHTEQQIKSYRKSFMRLFNKTGNHQESARLASLPKTKICKCGVSFSKKPKETYFQWDQREYHDIQCAGVHKRSDDSENQQICKLYSQGMNMSQIGKMFGVTHGCIKQRLIYCGIKIRRTRKTKIVTETYKNETTKLLSSWKTLNELMECKA